MRERKDVCIHHKIQGLKSRSDFVNLKLTTNKVEKCPH